MRMKYNDFTLYVPSAKLQHFAVLFLSRQLMLKRNKMKEMFVRGDKQMPVVKFEMYNSPQKGEEGRTRR